MAHSSETQGERSKQSDQLLKMLTEFPNFVLVCGMTVWGVKRTKLPTGLNTLQPTVNQLWRTLCLSFVTTTY